jgi:hypothetical protein
MFLRRRSPKENLNMIEWKGFHQFASLLGCALFLLAIGEAPAKAGTWDFATGPSSRDKEGERDWGVEIVPYLWLAGLNGQAGLPAVGTIPVEASFSDLASNLDGAFAGFLDARYRRWHLLVDGSWVRVKDTVSPGQASLVEAAVTTEVAFGIGGVSYELPLDWPAIVEVYLAARWWHVNLAASSDTPGGLLPPTVSGGQTEVGVDAVVGTRIRYDITEKWRVSFSADIGAGNADLDWNVFGGIGYMINSHIGLTAGYRILGVDYSRAGFVYDLRQSGLLLGINLVY